MTRPTLEVADVIRQYGAVYLARYGTTLSPEQHRALRAIAVCRTASAAILPSAIIGRSRCRGSFWPVRSS